MADSLEIPDIGSKRDYHKGCTLNPELSLHRTALRVEVILEIRETVTPQVPFHWISYALPTCVQTLK